MKKLNIFAFISLLIFFISDTAFAYIGLCCSKCGGNMPLTILGGGIPQTGEFRFKIAPMFMRMDVLRDGTDDIEPDDLLGMPVMDGSPTGKYMAVPLNMDMYMINLAAGYSFTDNFFGGIMLMWEKNEMDMRFNSMMKMTTGLDGYTMESDGLSDTMLMTKYRLYADDPLIPTSQISLFMGLSIPTGSIDKKNGKHPVQMRQGEQLPYSMQLGSGTFDPKIGLLYQGSSSPLWWGINGIYTGRWYDNSRDYRLGDEYSLDLYGMYQFRYDLVAMLQINGKYWSKINGEMDEVKTGESGRATKNDPNSPFMSPLFDPENYGGKKVIVTTGLQWQPYPLHIIEINVGIPVYQNLNGPQLKEDYRVMLSWYMELPTKKSIRYIGKVKSRLGF